MTKNFDIGKIGEDLACEYLTKKGYKILVRNYREKFGEIDVVAKQEDGALVFFEVKTLQRQDELCDGLTPEDNITPGKRRKMIRSCQSFAGKHQDLVSEDEGWRMDVIALTLGEGRRIVRIAHYENI